MRAIGKIPCFHIAIAGVDDLQDYFLMSPLLTTVHIDANKIGSVVSELLKSKLNNTSIEPTTLVDVDLIIRDSS